jgi:hypothetical protein
MSSATCDSNGVPAEPGARFVWAPDGHNHPGKAHDIAGSPTRVEENLMCLFRTVAVAIALVANVLHGLATPPAAHASVDEVPINGTYRATSIGDWAHTNEHYHDEQTVTATWSIRSSCTTFQECTGTVTSDQGWTAPLYTHDGTAWYVKHDVPNWERCADGTTFTGQQTFYFYAVDPNGVPNLGSPTMVGKDKTIGPSGACGRNQWLDIELPFRLDKIG